MTTGFSRVESLYRLQQATVKHSFAILAYAPEARNWTGIGRSPDGGNCGTNLSRVQKTYQHSGRAALMADWPRHNIRSRGERSRFPVLAHRLITIISLGWKSSYRAFSLAQWWAKLRGEVERLKNDWLFYETANVAHKLPIIQRS